MELQHFQIPTQRTFSKASCFPPSAFAGENGQAEKAQMTPQVLRDFTASGVCRVLQEDVSIQCIAEALVPSLAQ